jgi:hypothetical protein
MRTKHLEPEVGETNTPPRPSPPLGSADSADAEREKRSQRFAAGPRWLVLGFKARNLLWKNSLPDTPTRQTISKRGCHRGFCKPH